MPFTDFAELVMLSHVEKLRRLRAEIDKGMRSLDAGEGRPLDVEDFLREQNDRHGRCDQCRPATTSKPSPD
jgi:hypothetical protein